MSSTYLLINIGTIIIPLVFSFHPKLKFYERWKETLVAIVLVGSAFILWDVWFTEIGVWGFNPTYIVGVDLFGLPIEEWLFFVTIPYACMFTYHCFSVLITPKNWINTKWVSAALIILLLSFGLVYSDRLYTAITFLSLAVLLTLIQFVIKVHWLPRLYLSLLVLILPFFIVNGILTGTGIESEVVWYNSDQMIGVRLLTIPIEDFWYGTLLIMANVYLLESLPLVIKR